MEQIVRAFGIDTCTAIACRDVFSCNWLCGVMTSCTKKRSYKEVICNRLHSARLKSCTELTVCVVFFWSTLIDFHALIDLYAIEGYYECVSYELFNLCELCKFSREPSGY
jgi:hypothetical protein